MWGGFHMCPDWFFPCVPALQASRLKFSNVVVGPLLGTFRVAGFLFMFCCVFFWGSLLFFLFVRALEGRGRVACSSALVRGGHSQADKTANPSLTGVKWQFLDLSAKQKAADRYSTSSCAQLRGTLSRSLDMETEYNPVTKRALSVLRGEFKKQYLQYLAENLPNT